MINEAAKLNYEELLVNASPEHRGMLTAWRLRFGEEEACKRYTTTVIQDNSASAKTKKRKVKKKEVSRPKEVNKAKVAEPKPISKEAEKPKTSLKLKEAKNALDNGISVAIPTLILIAIYGVIFTLTAESMSEVVQTVVASKTETTKILGYGLAVIIDIAIFMFIGSLFDKRLHNHQRAFSGAFGILLILGTCASVFVSLDGRSSVKKLEAASNKLSKIESRVSTLSKREKETKAIYYQMVYGQNWERCLRILDSSCKLRGYRTAEAVEAKSAWQNAKSNLSKAESRLDGFDVGRVSKSNISTEASSQKRTEYFVIALWILAFVIKWYQKTVVPRKLEAE